MQRYLCRPRLTLLSAVQVIAQVKEGMLDRVRTKSQTLEVTTVDERFVRRKGVVLDVKSI